MSKCCCITVTVRVAISSRPSVRADLKPHLQAKVQIRRPKHCKNLTQRTVSMKLTAQHP